MRILNCFAALLFDYPLIQALRILSWLVCGIYATIPCYWMMVHPFAKRWRTARYKLKVLVPLWVAVWCVAWAASYPWQNAVLYHNAGSWVAALLLWAVSGFMYVHAGRELSFLRAIGRHELEPELHPNRLITVGVHRVVRHPMYLGHLCTMLGFALGAGTVACFALLAFVLASGAIMIVFEERELHDRFGPAWEEYCKRTPLILPRPK
jgi:protein-S-isoprenylcysteine O-methyltransferase Ste14